MKNHLIHYFRKNILFHLGPQAAKVLAFYYLYKRNFRSSKSVRDGKLALAEREMLLLLVSLLTFSKRNDMRGDSPRRRQIK